MGLEPTTSAVTGRRSNQLSHRALITPSKLYTAYLLDIFYPMTLREDFTFFTRTRPVTQNRLRASSCLRSANAQPSHLLCFGVPALLFSASASSDRSLRSWSSPRPISNSQLHALLHFHLCPIYLVVFKGSYFFRMGYLILRGASRLDAFSVYPVPTWLLGHEPGGSTDTPEVSPSRSSRTKDSSSQISYAHAG